MLEEATRQFGARMAVRWHAYELRPEPVPQPTADSPYIREHWQNRVLPMAAERGLVMKIPRRQIRSRRALQAALFAQEHGRFEAVDRALFRARFELDEDISDLAVLKRIAAEAGLDAEALAEALTANAYLDALASDLRQAAALGISGVPTAFIGPADDEPAAFFAGAEPVVGAVPYEWFADAIRRAGTAGPAGRGGPPAGESGPAIR